MSDEQPAPPSHPRDPWSQQVKDRWFLGVLASTILAVGYLFKPYLYVLGAAGVVVIVTWPIYEWVQEKVGAERRAAGAALTLLLLIVVVLGPVGTILYLALAEGVRFGAEGVTWVQSGGFQLWLWEFGNTAQENEWAVWALSFLPEGFDPTEYNIIERVSGPLQAGVLAGLNGLSKAVPQILASAAGFGLDAFIFLFAVPTFYMEGPAIVEAAKKMSPIDDEYEDRLFGVFAEFATNMVVGTLATAALQGLVSGIAYWLIGVPSVIFLSILTGICSFIPLIGTGIIWVPVALWALVALGWGKALFLTIWCIVITGSVDNVVKPLFLRGSSNIHPLLIFLAVFGGYAWLDLPGLLIGPVLVALAISMYKIYKEDFLGEEPEEVLDEGGGWMAWLSDRLMGLMGSGGAAPSEDASDAGAPSSPVEADAEPVVGEAKVDEGRGDAGPGAGTDVGGD